MKNIIKVLLVVMALVLAMAAFTACEPQQPEQTQPVNPTPGVCTHENIEFVLGTEPTCTEDGLTSGFKCKDCGEWTIPQELDPAGHDYTVEIVVDATCTEAGYTEMKCARCDATTDRKVIEPYGHELVDVEGKAATCTENGYSEYKACKNCDHIEGKTVIPAGHELVDVEGKAPTCTEEGYSDHKACKNCDYIEGKTVIPAGHNYVDGTCEVCKINVVYFVNVEKWTKVNAHMWPTSGAGTTWPGAAMTKTGEQVNGFDIYKVEYTAAYANIIFNNGSSQTADLVLAKGKYFCPLNSIWYDSASDVPSFEGITKTSYYLPGGFNAWKDANAFLKEGTSTVIRSYVALAANTTYEFKVKNGGTWYGSASTVSATSTTITFSSTNTNAKIKTACAGVYVFEFDTTTKKLTVIYPHTEVVVEGKDATCTETGLTDGKKCSVCGTVTVKQTVIPTLEHAWLDAEAVIKECGDCGLVWNSHFEGGKGTAEEPYLIKTAEQLANITHYYGTYTYFKVADGVKTIDMTGVGKLSLHGSFDGNGVKLVNLTTALFEKVGYNNNVEDIKISNVDATMNNTDGRAFVRNIYNGGKTTFENVALHGYIEGLYNMGSFYNYGTANLGGSEGADYTVEFLNSTSDVTLVCTTGNVAGGFAGHTYEGAGNSFTMIITNSSFTGKILTTTGKGNLYFAMTSDYNNANNKFIVDGEEIHFNNGQIPAAANLGKITVATPVAGESTYTVVPVEGAASFVVYLNAQVSAHNADGTYVANHNGMTWPLGNFTPEELAGYGLVTSAKIVNGTDHDFGFEYADGVLTIYSGRSDNYCSGNVYLQINQYDAEGNLLATGTLKVATIEHPHTFVGGDCTTDGVCGCGAKQKATGHVWSDVEAKAPTCTAAGYTAHKECEECGATEGKETLDKIAHADNNGDYKCDACSTKMLPASGEALSIKDALAIAKMQSHNTYTTQKYYVTGIVTNVYNTTYGNFYIKDAEGNELCIYGLYLNGTRYDAMSYKPVEGDEVTVYGSLGTYNSTYQMKNADLDEVVAHEHNYVHKVTDPTCTKEGYTTHTCSICNGYYVDSETEALGHTTTNGTCERCEQTLGGDAPVFEKFTADFNTVTSTNSSYVKSTTTSGWVATNCAVMGGGTSDSNPKFKVFGDAATRAFTLNGKTTAKGSVVSPTLTGGISALSFNFTNCFSESNGVDITITIKQNGTAVATKKLDQNSVTKLTAYTFTWEDIKVTGDFTIEITNNSPSGSTSNKDRVSIWNLEWTNNPTA